MSIPYGVCVGLLYGNAGLNEYSDDVIRSNDLREMLKISGVIANDEYESQFPGKQIASLRVSTNQKLYTYKVEYPKGEIENPLSDDEFSRRFHEMCKYAGKTDDAIKDLYVAVMKNTKTVKSIMEIM